MARDRPLAIETQGWLQGVSYTLGIAQPVHLIICSSRDEMLRILVQEVTEQAHDTTSESRQYSLLQPTIARVLTSDQIEVVLTSSVMQFRAYLSALSPAGERFKALCILGLPDLHLSANELSSQSLSRSVALAVETAACNGVDVHFLCPKGMSDHWEEDSPQRMSCIWERRMPILGTSGRSVDERRISGRTVTMGLVFGQWCTVVKAADRSTEAS